MISPETRQRLVNWNSAMALFHAAFAVVTLATADMDMALPLFRPEFTASPPVPEEDGFTTWVSARTLVQDTYSLRIAWVAFGFSALSALFHFLNAAPAPFGWRAWYLRCISEARCPQRWIEYSLSAPLQAIAIAHLTGTITTEGVVAIFALINCVMFFGHLCEVSSRPASPDTWTKPAIERLTPHFLGYVPFIFAVAMVLQVFSRASSFTYEDDEGVERGMPSFVYGIVASQLVLFSSFTVVQLVVTLRAPRDYIWGEVFYQLLSLLAKGTLSLLLLSNVIAISIFGGGM